MDETHFSDSEEGEEGKKGIREEREIGGREGDGGMAGVNPAVAGVFRHPRLAGGGGRQTRSPIVLPM